MPIDTTLQPWWLKTGSDDNADLLNEINGLSSDEAKTRLAKYGPNTFNEKKDSSLVIQYLLRFKNPLIIILLFASLASALTGDVTNFMIISFMILLSVTLDFVQEYRANAAAEKLKLSVSVRVTAIRDNQPTEISISKVVPGDVILLLLSLIHI